MRHSADIGPKGEAGHDGTDGSTMTSRIEDATNWDGKIGENLAFGGGEDSVIELL
jgi:uncharacterized protein YkwD